MLNRRSFLIGAGLAARVRGAEGQLKPVPFPKVTLKDNFWAPRIATNARVTLPACLRKCEESGHIDNFKKAARLMPGAHKGTPFYDGPVYKTIEGAAYTLISNPDAALDRRVEELISIIRAAQEPDGYLYTARTIDPAHVPAASGRERWSNLRESHELFLAGHLYEAAVAHFQATGRRSLLDVAIRNANLVVDTFGPGKRTEVPGHEEIELALLRLYGVTGESKYAVQARRFVDGRGRRAGRVPGGIPRDPTYSQDHAPVLRQNEAVGHAVRAVYLYAAMAEMDDPAYGAACERLWNDVVRTKMYLTGGLGARAKNEAFGEAYELPNETAYAETCASIGSVFWNHRMFLRTRDAKYLDVLERTLYNGLLSGVSYDGARFFYPNVLASDGKTPFNMGAVERQPWFQVACCPTNLVRFLPSLPGYVYSQAGRDVYVALYAASVANLSIGGQTVRLEQSGDYPWSGTVRLRVLPERPVRFTLRLRVPGWAIGRPTPGDLYQYVDGDGSEPLVVLVNGRRIKTQISGGFAVLERMWRSGEQVEIRLPMKVRRVVTSDAVAANRGRVAVERGPLVYCFEGADNTRVSELEIADRAPLKAVGHAEVAGGVECIQAGKYTAIPYYAWNHRGAGEMAVWVRRS